MPPFILLHKLNNPALPPYRHRYCTYRLYAKRTPMPSTLEPDHRPQTPFNPWSKAWHSPRLQMQPARSAPARASHPVQRSAPRESNQTARSALQRSAPRACNQPARSALHRKQSAHRAAHRPHRQPARRASPTAHGTHLAPAVLRLFGVDGLVHGWKAWVCASHRVGGGMGG